MTSEELKNIKVMYENYRIKLTEIIERNSKVLESIEDSDKLLADSYSINDLPADNGDIGKSIESLKERLNDFKEILKAVDSKIIELTQSIKIALDKEVAEAMANKT